MEEKEFLTHSSRETEEAGSAFAKNLKPGDVVVLTGELGAGKTTFVLGMAKTLNVKSRVVSPTFVLVRKHKGKLGSKKINLYHIDLYRLEGLSAIASIGLEDIFEDENALFLIEWGEKYGSLKANFEVNFTIPNSDPRSRIIKING